MPTPIKQELSPKYQRALKAALVSKVSRNSTKIINAMVRAATGYKIMKEVGVYDSGNRKVGQRMVEVEVPPDTAMATYLMNQVAGKPVEVKEHKGSVTLKMDDDD